MAGQRRTRLLAHVRIGEGKEILYLHGWGCSHEVFSLHATPRFCYTAPDLYGFGNTPAPSYPVDLDYYVRGVVDLMTHYHMEDTVVVGHSFGARIALRLAQCTDRVQGLVLVGAAGLRPRRGIKIYARIAYAKWCRLCRRTPPVGSEDYRRLTGAMRKTFVNVVHTYQDKELPHIHCPVLLVWGDKDTQTPLYMLRRFQRGLPNSRTVIMEGCDHFCFAQQPARFERLIREWADNL